jgi:hypothetical protein
MRGKYTFLVLTFACAGLIACLPAASSAALIDNFDNTTIVNPLVAAGAGGSDGPVADGVNAGVIGGYRTGAIPGGTPVTGISLSVDLVLGQLAFSLATLSSGSATITYDANGSGLGGGAGVDLTDAGASQYFTFDITSIDQGNVDLIVGVMDALAASDSVTLSGAGVGTQQFNFSSFTGVDFTKITKVTLEIQGVAASDLSLDSFFTSGQIGGSVPEPSTLAMFGLGAALCGVVALRRRK